MKFSETISSWGNLTPVKSGIVYRPERFAQMNSILESIDEKTFIPTGNLRSYGDVCLNSDGAHLSMKRLNRILEFDKEKGIVTAEAGTKLIDLIDFSVRHGFLPLVAPGTGFCTLGGALGNDVHGKNHEQYGSFSQYVLSFTLLTSDHVIHHVSPEAMPDLFYATMGGIGLTGVILTVTLQLQKVESPTLRVKRQRMSSLSNLMDGLQTIKDDYSVAWIDSLARGKFLGRGILETAHLTTIEIPYNPPAPFKVPFMLPSFVLNKYSVRLFNHFYYNRSAADGREVYEDFRTFSFPLDGILAWNKLYGRRGFYQFQCVLPEDSAETHIRQMLRLTSKSGLSSFLAVLKKLGPQGKGLLSFPQPGYTLAMDFAAKPKTVTLLKELEEITLSAGGRVYLAKDHILSENNFDKMYPNKQKFLDIVKEYNPNMRLSSDCSRRLGL